MRLGTGVLRIRFNLFILESFQIYFTVLGTEKISVYQNMYICEMLDIITCFNKRMVRMFQRATNFTLFYPDIYNITVPDFVFVCIYFGGIFKILMPKIISIQGRSKLVIGMQLIIMAELVDKVIKLKYILISRGTIK